MEPKLGGKNIVYDPVVTDMKALGKRSLEWDLNDWKWDSGLLCAKSADNPLNPGAHDHRGSHCFPLGPELQLVPNSHVSITINDNGTRELKNKRAVFVDRENEGLNNDRGLLNLNLGEQVYPIVESEVDRGDVQNGMNSRNAGTSHPVCQVEGCKIDLRNARDYNRRHKVCELHSKASEALVGNVTQRFCQQCSRFHAIEEFDGEKRSCRKRLAGHNKRRRKTPETNPNVGPMTDGINAGQILNLLLRVLSNMHTNGSIQATDQDLLSHILSSIAVLSDGSNTSRLLQGPQSSLNVGTSNGIPQKGHSRNQEPSQTTPCAQSALTRENQIEIPQTTFVSQPKVNQVEYGTLSGKGVQDVSVEKHILGGIDLNTVYNEDSQDCMDHMANGIGSDTRTNWAKQTLPSPPPTSGNSASTSGLASSNSGEEQSRTDRIIFKLFDKDPNDLPSVLKTQILDWLSQTPTDIEGYIRPGCIVLTLYLRLNTSIWEQFSYDISSSLTRLLDVSNDPFWKTGWIYTRIQQRAAFICDGQVILDTPLPFKTLRSRISSISPIALPAGETVSLVVRGSNLSGPTSRLLCAIEGRYLVQENCSRLVEGDDIDSGQDNIQSLSFSCSIPNVLGRGFVEVEDYDFTGCFFPFIVAEPEVCHEICMLESEMQVGSKDDNTQDYNKALEFVHEMGWLLHRNSVRMKEKQLGHPLSSFPFKRLKCLVEFSMDHEWCAVLRKLLDLLFSGIVDIGDWSSIDDGLADIALLHTAVRRNSRSMVEFLLGYVPSNTLEVCQKNPDGGPPKPNSMLFRPDVAGVGGLTPLHIAASSASSDNVLDALLEDPGMVGIEAWKNALDSTGLTPCDYASLRGHYRYLNLVQRKINQKLSSKHVVLDIPSISQTQTNKLKPTNFNSFYTEKPQVRQCCKLCDQMPDQQFRAAPLKFRPVMISLVAIAVVCVCTALIFKSDPQVLDIFRPFRWETLKFGAM